MISPDDMIPLDDAEDSDKEDQMSQQDIHSNGLEEERTPAAENNPPAIDLLQQALDASEASFTLDADKGIAPQGKK
jgi:hypothetical protein